jgi:hypothetical protein
MPFFLTFRPRPSHALQGRDKGVLKVNLEHAPAFRPEKAEGLTGSLQHLFFEGKEGEELVPLIGNQ